MTTRYSAVLFDLDGTLLDTHDLILTSMRHTMTAVLGREFSDEELMRKVGQPLETQMDDFAGGDAELSARLAATYRTYNEAIHDEVVRAFPGTAEVLAVLRAGGLPLGVVTSKRHALAQRGLEVAGIAEYFDVLVGPDDWPEHKPHPGGVRHACALVGFAPAECLYVGDSPYDMQAGAGAGCATAAALWGMFSRDTLGREHPTFMLADIAELPGVC